MCSLCHTRRRRAQPAVRPRSSASSAARPSARPGDICNGCREPSPIERALPQRPDERPRDARQAAAIDDALESPQPPRTLDGSAGDRARHLAREMSHGRRPDAAPLRQAARRRVRAVRLLDALLRVRDARAGEKPARLPDRRLAGRAAASRRPRRATSASTTWRVAALSAGAAATVSARRARSNTCARLATSRRGLCARPALSVHTRLRRGPELAPWLSGSARARAIAAPQLGRRRAVVAAGSDDEPPRGRRASRRASRRAAARAPPRELPRASVAARAAAHRAALHAGRYDRLERFVIGRASRRAALLPHERDARACRGTPTGAAATRMVSARCGCRCSTASDGTTRSRAGGSGAWARTWRSRWLHQHLPKGCLHCGYRITHYHGHACHHIRPGSGCPNCGTHLLLVPPARPPGTDCGCRLFCLNDAILEHLERDPYPRLAVPCPICPDCRPRRPCAQCDDRRVCAV